MGGTRVFLNSVECLRGCPVPFVCIFYSFFLPRFLFILPSTSVLNPVQVLLTVLLDGCTVPYRYLNHDSTTVGSPPTLCCQGTSRRKNKKSTEVIGCYAGKRKLRSQKVRQITRLGRNILETLLSQSRTDTSFRELFISPYVCFD